MERDDEWKGSGNHYTTHFRQYDPRLGRWMSIDPEMEKFPDKTPYNAVFNNPITTTDPDGDCPEGEDCETYEQVDGNDIEIPESAEVETYEKDKTLKGKISGKEYSVKKGQLKSFTYNGKEYEATADSESGEFKGYGYKEDEDSPSEYYVDTPILTRREQGVDGTAEAYEGMWGADASFLLNVGVVSKAEATDFYEINDDKTVGLQAGGGIQLGVQDKYMTKYGRISEFKTVIGPVTWYQVEQTVNGVRYQVDRGFSTGMGASIGIYFGGEFGVSYNSQVDYSDKVDNPLPKRFDKR